MEKEKNLKKGNPRKMYPQSNLKWGINTFRVFGITFSLNLHDMPNLNYNTIKTDENPCAFEATKPNLNW